MFLRNKIIGNIEYNVLKWKFLNSLELREVSYQGFGNDSKITEMSVEITIQIDPELQHRMKAAVWQQPKKEADGVQHPT
ncbi:hypothetical protein TNCV_3362671 [Trichonephila clavipes]|nr:hypothetical protein TNCV_3362671 [Trichonephila clavipes]